jgi:hypothetical protein
VYYDQSGNPYIFGNQQADIYQPGTNKKVTVPAVPGSPVPSYEQASGARGLSAPTNPATLAQNSSLATYTPTPELQQTVLPKPSNFEGMIEQPKPVNLDITKPIPGLDIMPKLPDQKTTQAQPTYSPAPTPTPAVNLDLSKPQPGLTIQKPAQVASPVQNLATSIGNALSQSPFSYFKKKLFG